MKRKYMTKADRFRILKRDNYTCRYCGKNAEDGVKLEIDHVISLKDGGDNESENLITSCFNCNRGKSATSEVRVIKKEKGDSVETNWETAEEKEFLNNWII